MSYVVADPEMMTSAATNLATIGSTLDAAHAAAAARTVAVTPAAADEVSASIAHLFSGYAQDYQAVADQASAFHEEFAQHLTGSSASYASAEAAIASFLQDLDAEILNWLNNEATQLINVISYNAENAAITAIFSTLYALAALNYFQMTGQFLSYSAFQSQLLASVEAELQKLFPTGYPVF
jgi:hypothetical protein